MRNELVMTTINKVAFLLAFVAITTATVSTNMLVDVLAVTVTALSLGAMVLYLVSAFFLFPNESKEETNHA